MTHKRLIPLDSPEKLSRSNRVQRKMQGPKVRNEQFFSI